MIEEIRTSWKDEWVFEFAGGELMTKAQAKVDHHKERLAHWQGKNDELREAYIKSVQESADTATKKEAEQAEQLAKLTEDWLQAEAAGGGMSVSSLRATNTYGAPQAQKVEIMGDTEIYKDLQNALRKVQEHRTKVENFSRWLRLFKRTKDEVRRLTYSDVVFFGL